MENTNKYPNLSILMASMPKPMKRTELSKIIKKTPAATTKKLQGKIDFKLTEIFEVVAFFQQHFPGITAEKIFAPTVTIVNEELKGA